MSGLQEKPKENQELIANYTAKTKDGKNWLYKTWEVAAKRQVSVKRMYEILDNHGVPRRGDA